MCCCRNIETTRKSSFCFIDSHVSNLAIVHGVFPRESPVGCEWISESDAANICFCCGSVPTYVYGHGLLIHDYDSWMYKYCQEIITMLMASLKFPSTFVEGYFLCLLSLIFPNVKVSAFSDQALFILCAHPSPSWTHIWPQCWSTSE